MYTIVALWCSVVIAGGSPEFPKCITKEIPLTYESLRSCQEQSDRFNKDLNDQVSFQYYHSECKLVK